MRLILFRHAGGDNADAEPSVLECALSAAPLRTYILDALLRQPWAAAGGPNLAGIVGRAMQTQWAIPHGWRAAPPTDAGRVVSYTDRVNLGADGPSDIRKHPWLLVSDGSFVARMNDALLARAISTSKAHVIAVTVSSELCAYRERVRLTQEGWLVGYRRLYQDSIEPVPAPTDWPHHVLVRTNALDALFTHGLPSRFAELIDRCTTRGLAVESIAIAGSVLDLRSEQGLLALCRDVVDEPASARTCLRRPYEPNTDDVVLSSQSRLIGSVAVGKRVRLDDRAIVIGPAMLCDDSVVGAGAVVENAIVGDRGAVSPGGVLRNAVVLGSRRAPGRSTAGSVDSLRDRIRSKPDGAFRKWRRPSYAGCVKRAIDIVAAVVVLALFAPVIPFIALGVKINSSGPVFFKDRRQGLHGRPFNCIKFRTMKTGADKMQQTLRFISEVDGPQFKVADDPRITTVGRFLRETYLDEVPQFYNVLVGDMSVVGPRPSPESENTLCPWWRDARLSVRPGITGLWQVCRTREPMKDFQEWIHYDTRYVRELSLRLDLWICWRTFRKMVGNFISQF